jgi:acyl-CoA synthetase (AMP-forming)/AMP-acid ligase II
VLLAYNCVEWMEIYVALARAGLVAVPINFRLLAPEIAYIARHSEARASSSRTTCATGSTRSRELPLDAGCYVHFGGDTPAGWRGYEALIAAASPAPPAVTVKPEDPFALMYTSGTTGKPKGAVRNHEGNALIALATALEFRFSRDDTALLVMPMCHANSLYFGLTFMYLGATVVIDDHKSFDPEALLATLAREKVTFTSLVPTHYIMMLGLPEAVKARYDVGAVEKLLISSAPGAQGHQARDPGALPQLGLYELYGSSEAGWVTLLRPEEQIERLGSVGREWAGSGAIRIIDPAGNEVPDGEVGELLLAHRLRVRRLLEEPRQDRRGVPRRVVLGGRHGERDADGYIHLVDRKSNMIISGGENIYPSEVEAVLGGHPKVKDVAVIGIPHDKWGETVLAVVVLARGRRRSEAEISTGAGPHGRLQAAALASSSWPTRTCRARRPARSCTARCASGSWPRRSLTHLRLTTRGGPEGEGAGARAAGRDLGGLARCASQLPCAARSRARRGNSLRSFVATLRQSRRVRLTKHALRACGPAPALLTEQGRCSPQRNSLRRGKRLGAQRDRLADEVREAREVLALLVEQHLDHRRPRRRRGTPSG